MVCVCTVPSLHGSSLPTRDLSFSNKIVLTCKASWIVPSPPIKQSMEYVLKSAASRKICVAWPAMYIRSELSNLKTCVFCNMSIHFPPQNSTENPSNLILIELLRTERQTSQASKRMVELLSSSRSWIDEKKYSSFRLIRLFVHSPSSNTFVSGY